MSRIADALRAQLAAGEAEAQPVDTESPDAWLKEREALVAQARLTKQLAEAQSQIEELTRERDAWTETANFHLRNEEFYRGLIQQTGQLLGPEVYISDDGSVQDGVLALKVPELVKKLVEGSAEGRYTAWLMERPDPAGGLPQYWNGFHADAFTKDPWQAIQFARKTDALTAGHKILYAPFGWTLVEHAFTTEAESADTSEPNVLAANRTVRSEGGHVADVEKTPMGRAEGRAAWQAIRDLITKWHDPEYWQGQGCVMDCRDCAIELEALLPSPPAVAPDTLVDASSAQPRDDRG